MAVAHQTSGEKGSKMLGKCELIKSLDRECEKEMRGESKAVIHCECDFYCIGKYRHEMFMKLFHSRTLSFVVGNILKLHDTCGMMRSHVCVLIV